MNGTTLLTSVGRACGLTPSGSRGQTGHARQHVGPDSLHLWFPRPAACCHDGSRAREIVGSQENRKARAMLWFHFLPVRLKNTQKHTKPGASPHPILMSPTTRGILLSWTPPWRPRELMTCHLNSPVHPIPAWYVQKEVFALQLVLASQFCRAWR